VEVLGIHYLTFYVPSLLYWQQWLVEKLGFVTIETSAQKILLQSGGVVFQLEENAAYLATHPPGIGEVVLRVDCLDRFPTQEVQIVIQTQHSLTIQPIGAVKFTFSEAPAFTPQARGFVNIDHIVFNVNVGTMDALADWFEQTFGWIVRQQFTIVGTQSSLKSCVIKNILGTLQIAINEPTSPNSQIQEFIDYNRGPGIQHIALTSVDLLQEITQFRARGIQFLAPPSDYYAQLPLAIAEELEPLGILADLNPDQPQQQLLQIFTQPIFSEPTFFFEFIQRVGGRQGFGEGNFQALFRAIEQQQALR
jgi:4-hydroxyphenylpyruvate dioxygenase